MKFKELKEILDQIGSLARIFDHYKPLRQPLREFAKYLKEKYPPVSGPSFWDMEVPQEDIVKFNPLYEHYSSILFENTGKKLESIVQQE